MAGLVEPIQAHAMACPRQKELLQAKSDSTIEHVADPSASTALETPPVVANTARTTASKQVLLHPVSTTSSQRLDLYLQLF